jgi:hypothetical protein
MEMIVSLCATKEVAHESNAKNASACAYGKTSWKENHENNFE